MRLKVNAKSSTGHLQWTALERNTGHTRGHDTEVRPMPGGRLTHEERRQIAEGLVEGLTSTEIAGRLDRPISTIPREVARNGGAGASRADAAQQSTVGRARRRKQAPVPAAP